MKTANAANHLVRVTLHDLEHLNFIFRRVEMTRFEIQVATEVLEFGFLWHAFTGRVGGCIAVAGFERTTCLGEFLESRCRDVEFAGKLFLVDLLCK